MHDTCVCCGTPVPEGRQVCPSCEHRYDPDEFFSAERQLTKKLTKEKRQLTNADRIRAYTDLELAMFMTAVAQKSAEKLCESLKTVDVDLSNCDFGILAQAHLDWLQQEATND